MRSECPVHRYFCGYGGVWGIVQFQTTSRTVRFLLFDRLAQVLRQQVFAFPLVLALPVANAIFNPWLIPAYSPYCCLAGVGVAYLLGLGVAERLGYGEDLTEPLLELCTLGTIADIAPLTGVNRRWVQQGLRLLTRSRLLGVRTLIQVAGLGTAEELNPDHVGFQIGPRINAVGRIGDPQVVIELFTTEDETLARQRAEECEATNLRRRQLCSQIEQEAMSICEQQPPDFSQEPVLVLVQPGWHHGVIGIVASRLVERYGVPVFLGTYENEAQTVIRGSARGIPEFHVYEALHASREFLERYGGHRAAGGFTLAAAHFSQWRERLQSFGRQCLQPHHLRPLVELHAQAQLGELTLTLYDELQRLQPCGMANPAPQFWSQRVRVVEQQVMGKEKNHAKLTVTDGTGEKKVLAWHWAPHVPLPEWVDIAYTLRPNEFQGQTTLELQLLGVRYPIPQLEIKPAPAHAHTPLCVPLENLEHLLSQNTDKKFLLYGYQRPELPHHPHLDYDRPRGTYGALILWSLPPAPIYLRFSAGAHGAPNARPGLFSPRPHPSPSIWRDFSPCPSPVAPPPAPAGSRIGGLGSPSRRVATVAVRHTRSGSVPPTAPGRAIPPRDGDDGVANTGDQSSGAVPATGKNAPPPA